MKTAHHQQGLAHFGRAGEADDEVSVDLPRGVAQDDPMETATIAEDGSTGGVRELRLAVTSEDWEAAVAFYRDDLGLPQLADFSSDRGRVVLLDAGRATLELIDPDQAAFIDHVEVGSRVAGHVRVALEVADAAATCRRLASAGADILAQPTPTPWNSLNARLQAPAGLQLTLFQELGP